MSPDMMSAETAQDSDEPMLTGPPKPIPKPEIPAPTPAPAPSAMSVASPARAAPARAKRPDYKEMIASAEWVQEEEGVVPGDTEITQCGKCRASYVITPEMLGEEGRRVKCAVCGNAWFQSPGRLFTAREGTSFKAYDVEAYQERAPPRQRRELPSQDDVQGKTRHHRRGAITLFVGNLPFSYTEDDLRSLMETHGPIASISIIVDAETGRARGYGFVGFEKEEDGKAAEAALDGSDIGGRQIKVNVSEDRFGDRGRGRGGRGRGRGRGGRGRGN